MWVSHYQILKNIGEKQGFTYTIAQKKDSSSIQLLKWPTEATADSLERLHYEWNIYAEKTHHSILSPQQKIQWGTSFALSVALPHCNFEFLGDYLTKKSLSITAFLQAALHLLNSLDSLYKSGLRHKNIHPDAMLYDQKTGEVWLCGLQFCSELASEESQAIPQDDIPLAYISPEQSGRIQRVMDYRSDLYSLGISFYQMLTGKLPFQAEQALDLCYQHLAETAPCPRELRPEIPAVLAQIALKLLHKSPELRYQSVRCLQADLAHCQQQWQSLAHIPTFMIAAQDVSPHFMLVEHLYGREVELEQLKEAFAAVCSGTRKQHWFLVSGDAGVGKTVLVQALQQRVIQAQGYFISGKFDQFQRHKPYHAVLEAFKSLIAQILTENQRRIKAWAHTIERALGHNISVLLQVLPELSYLIDTDSKQTALSDQQIQQRFQRSMQQLLFVFCSGEQPLVLFFDDLQWIDTASFKLIEQVLSQLNVSKLLLVSAHRDQEIALHDPAKLILDRLYRADIELKELHLIPLKQESVTQLLTDTLHKQSHQLTALAQLVHLKTQGNPFYIKAFLRRLYKQGLLYFDSHKVAWGWQLEAIEAFPHSDNVVDLMTQQLKTMAEEQRNLLTLAACIGHQFELSLLATVAKQSPQAVQHLLFIPLQHNLLIQRGLVYRFSHDRIQEAAYHLLSASQKQRLHRSIGTLIFNHCSETALSDTVFNIVDHLNKSDQYHSTDISGETLAQLNVMAGKKAQTSVAYSAARAYFQAGLMALQAQWGEAEYWQKNAKLAYQLQLNIAEMHYLCLDFDKATQLYEALDQHNPSLYDQVNINILRCKSATLQGQWQRGVEYGLQNMALLGFATENEVSQDELAQLWGKIEADIPSILLIRYQENRHLSQRHQLILQVFSSLVSPLYVHNTRLLLLVTFKLIRYAIQHDFLQHLHLPLVLCGALASGLLDQYKQGYLIAKKSYDLVQQNPQLDSRGMVSFIFVLSAHWIRPIKEDFAIYQQGYEYALNESDLIFASYCVGMSISEKMMHGHPLKHIKKDIKQYEPFVQHVNSPVVYIFLILKQTLCNLEDKTATGSLLDSKTFNSQEVLDTLKQHYATSAMVAFFLHQLQLALLYEDRGRIESLQLACSKLIHRVVGHLVVFEFHFLSALSFIQKIAANPQQDHQQTHLTLQSHYQQLSLYANACPDNYLQAKKLIEAELAHLSGDLSHAIQCYDEAIQLAHTQGFLHYEAMANEYAAKFWLSRNKNTLALYFLQKAYQSFEQWGAIRKLRYMQTQYAEFSNRLSINELGLPQSSAQSICSQLELNTLINAAQSIINQTNLNDLVRETLQIVMKQTGATRAVLLVNQAESIPLVHMSLLNGKQINCIAIPVDNSDTHYPNTVVNYVNNRQKDLLLEDIKVDQRFCHDPYFQENSIKSLFCLPLLDKKQLSGVLYLDNNLLTAAFHHERQQLIQILAAYAAVAINKATLYQQLSAEILERKKAQSELHAALKKVEKSKQRLEAENLYLQEHSKLVHNFTGIIGQSKPIRAVLKKIELVAPTTVNVLVTGESGTGKELIAQAIHERSQRQQRPLIKVNCSAIPKDLFESEFFGHTRGAFTGAVSDRIGRFELADGATLFLDEIGEIPLSLQSKLLRVLQEGEFERLGDNKTYKVDVRIIAATNRNLEKAITLGEFRQDLYFRLCVFPLAIPPLRQRASDITLLAEHFITLAAIKMNKPPMQLTQGNAQALQAYQWPGNVRELQNVIERAVIIAPNNRLEIRVNMPISTQQNSLPHVKEKSHDSDEILTEEAMRDVYRHNIIRALQKTQGRVSGKQGAAELLGLKPSTLNSKIKSLNINLENSVLNK